MNFLKRLLIAFSLTFTGYFKPKDAPSVAEIEEQLEPAELRDEWQTMMHHDDVTPRERALLESDDPADILEAREAIFARQAEFQAWWDDREERNRAFYGKYAKEMAAGVSVPEIDTLEGWEDDDDMPEYYVTIMQIPGSMAGKEIKVPYDLGETLAVRLGPDPSMDDPFDFMMEYLSEVYTERGELTDQDYTYAEFLWGKKIKDMTNGN